MASARAAAQPRPVDNLTEDDVWDLQEYFERRFKGEDAIKALAAGGFWTHAAELAPCLKAPDRAKLLGVLWGEIEPFTRLFLSLYEALEQLGFPTDAYCAIEALVDVQGGAVSRRTDSIIDVNTLNGLGGEVTNRLAVTARSGRPVELPRSSVAALVAELRITMRDKPWAFFDHTDLLDFPGARSREIIPDIRRFLKQPRSLESLFLRGKVAYLFERYCAEQELTSMLLCIGPSNQEVRTLPGIVKEWIDLTHGADPAARAANQTALFLVLTKFDAEFAEAAGQSESSEARWSARLNASLLGFFGKVHDWPFRWHPDKPFDNSYWLRNPNFKAKHILEYGADGLETGLRSSEAARIARSREEYVGNPDVKAHFSDPGRAWDEAFRLNDGGVTYLAESLSPVCSPEIKLRQIAGRLGIQRLAMRERLSRYFVGGDLAEQRAKRVGRAEEIVKSPRRLRREAALRRAPARASGSATESSPTSSTASRPRCRSPRPSTSRASTARAASPTRSWSTGSSACGRSRTRRRCAGISCCPTRSRRTSRTSSRPVRGGSIFAARSCSGYEKGATYDAGWESRSTSPRCSPPRSSTPT